MPRDGTLIKDVLNAVIKGKQTASEIEQFILSNKSSSIRGALRRLASRGDIERISRGKYAGKRIATLADGLPLSESQSNALTSSINGFYLSGLQYSRDIGVKIFGDYSIDEAEEILREYASVNVGGYNDDFYGIGDIPYDGYSPIDEVIRVNLG